MEEYIQSLIENNEEEQLVQLLKSEKEAVSQLQQEKNELLEYIESFLKEQESTEQLLQSLQKENSQLKEEIQARFRSSSNMESEYTQNFDTFGGEGEDTLTKNKLQEAQETIENLQKQLNIGGIAIKSLPSTQNPAYNLKQTRTIENKSKETDIQNLTEKLRISEANNEKSSRAIADAEEHFKKEIEAIRASGRTTGEDLKKITQAKDQAELSLKSLKQDHGELQAKFRKIQDNYAALETTCNETQAELEEIREKYDQDIEKIANDLQDSEKRIQLEQLENK